MVTPWIFSTTKTFLFFICSLYYQIPIEKTFRGEASFKTYVYLDFIIGLGTVFSDILEVSHKVVLRSLEHNLLSISMPILKKEGFWGISEQIWYVFCTWWVGGAQNMAYHPITPGSLSFVFVNYHCYYTSYFAEASVDLYALISTGPPSNLLW